MGGLPGPIRVRHPSTDRTVVVDSMSGPVLNRRGSRKRASYLNELVIHEIRNNTSSNYLFSCCKIEFTQLWYKSLNPRPSVGGLRGPLCGMHEISLKRCISFRIHC